MKKQTITGIVITACVALCAGVWLWSVEGEGLPAGPVKAAVISEIEAGSENLLLDFHFADTSEVKSGAISGNVPEKLRITAEEKKQKPIPFQVYQPPKAFTSTNKPHKGNVRVEEGEKQIYIPGFGWIKDEGGGARGTMVGKPGDKLTGNKIGQMGGGTIVHGKGDINKRVGVMGGSSETPPRETMTLATEQPEPIDGEIHIVFVEVPVKNSIPPPYKPDTMSP